MDIATILGILTGSTFVLLAMANPSDFLDFPSVLIVCGGTFSLILFSFPLQNVVSIGRYFGYTVIPPKPGADQSKVIGELEKEKVIGELEKGIVMFTKMKSYAQATGWVGFLIGLVLTLQNIGPDFNELAEIAPNAAIALHTVLYGNIIAYFICMPVSTKLQCRLDELKKAS